MTTKSFPFRVLLLSLLEQFRDAYTHLWTVSCAIYTTINRQLFQAANQLERLQRLRQRKNFASAIDWCVIRKSAAQEGIAIDLT